MSHMILVNTHAKGCKLKKGEALSKYQAEKIGPDGIAELLKAGFLKEGSDQATPVIAEEAPVEEISADQIVEDEPVKPKKGKKA